MGFPLFSAKRDRKKGGGLGYDKLRPFPNEFSRPVEQLANYRSFRACGGKRPPEGCNFVSQVFGFEIYVGTRCPLALRCAVPSNQYKWSYGKVIGRNHYDDCFDALALDVRPSKEAMHHNGAVLTCVITVVQKHEVKLNFCHEWVWRLVLENVLG